MMAPTYFKNAEHALKYAHFEKIGYEPHPGQQLFHDSQARFRMANCGRRFGKSTAAARDLEPLLFQPNKTFWIVGPTYELAEREFSVIWQDLIIGLGIGKHPKVKSSFNVKGGDMQIKLPWNTTVSCKSAKYAEYLVGDALDGVIMSEAAKQDEDTWRRYILPALSDRKGFATFPTCVVGSTLLATDEGIVRLRDLAPSDSVPGNYSEYGRQVAGFAGSTQLATKFYDNGVWETRKITNQLGDTLEGTLNHPVWTIDGWKELQDVQVGDYIATRVGADLWGNDDDVSLFEDFVADINLGKLGRPEGSSDFDVTLTDDLAYLIGLIVGDGYVDFTPNRRRVVVTCAEDEIETQEFLASYGFVRYGSDKVHWTLSNSRFILFLEWLGMSQVIAPFKHVPERLFSCSKSIVLNFLSGLFDADGTAHKTKMMVGFTSASRTLVKEVQFLLLNAGIVAKMGSKLSSPTNNSNAQVDSLCYTLSMDGYFAKEFHDIVGFRLTRKQRDYVVGPRNSRFYGVPGQAERILRLRKKFRIPSKGIDGPNRFVGYATLDKILTFIEKTSSNFNADEDYLELKKLSNERYYWNKVTSVNNGKAHTYDLVIPETHAFVSNSFISHNTPEGFNWYFDLWMLGKDKEFPEHESWKFPSWLNTHLFPDGEQDAEIKLLRRTMQTEAFIQEIEADFGSFVGKIYPEWDIQTHVTETKFNPAWPNYIAFDFGYTNPTAAIEFQIDPMDRIHIWREYYKSFTTIEDHISILKRRDNPPGYRIDLCFGDAAAPEAVDALNQSFAPTVADPLAKSNWRQGINRVRGFMRRQTGEDEFGGPIYDNAFFVDPSCGQFIREMSNYKAPEQKNAKNLQESGNKQDDHGLDAIRYGLVHIFDLGVTASLSSVYQVNEGFTPENQTARGLFTNSSMSDNVSMSPALSGSGFVTKGVSF